MKPYFERMDVFGKALKPGRKKRAEASAEATRAQREAAGQARGDSGGGGGRILDRED